MNNIEKLYGIQALRFFAAMVVVNYHLYAAVPRINNTITLPEILSFGYIGVDIFFVISGYVIAFAVHKNINSLKPTQFLLKRAARIYPTYWVVTCVILIAMQIFPEQINRSYSTEPSVIKSLFLFPQPGNPILNVGWSLEYEIWFYILITIAAYTARRSYIYLLTIILALTIYIYPTKSEIFNLILSPYNFEFTFGVLAFHAELLPRQKIKKYLICILYLSPLAVLLATNALNYTTEDSDWTRLIISLPIATTIFFFFRCLENIIYQERYKIMTDKLGDISYSIYLTHVITLNIALILIKKVGIDDSAFLIILSTNVFVVVCAVIFYIIVDLPMQHAAKKLL